jgi:regulator of cell morphogenesis and NO signaling
VITKTSTQAQPRGEGRIADIDLVTKTYHTRLRGRLSFLYRVMANVATGYGLSYFDLHPLAQRFVKLERALRSHVANQEEQLFPLLRLVDTDRTTEGESSQALIAAIREGSHTDVRIAELFGEIRELTDGYDPAADACSAYQDVVHALGKLDQQTRAHFAAEEELLAGMKQLPCCRVKARSGSPVAK